MTTKDLLVAAAAGDLESIGLFREAGAEIDGTDRAGNTALIKAASGGHLEAVETLLGLGADPRRINAVGRDALISASAKGYEDVARMLLHRGADATLKDTEGWGALSIAAYNGHAGVVSLLSATATPAELDDALLVASFSGDTGVVNALLGQGANINARSPESKTPLMIAASTGKLDAVRVLLQNQANPFAVDRENKTAANLSQDAGFETVTQLITNPDAWGTSKEGLAAAAEMAQAQEALEGEGVEETLSKKAPVALSPQTPAAGGDNAAEASSGSSLASAPLRATPVRDGSAGSGSSSPSVSADDDAETAAGNGDDRPALRANATALVARPTSVPQTAGAVSPRSTQAKIEAARRVREQSKSKPIVALNGSTIHSRTPEIAPVKGMVLAAYHEESLPILVDGVDGSSATVRRLDVTSDSPVAVEEGGMIPGTSYRVEEVTSRFVSSKEGKGRMVDVSRIRIEDTKNGSSHLLVKDVSGQTADTYAILTAPNSQYRYVVKAGDVFRTTQPDIGAVEYQVLDIRPTGVVIKDLATEEVVTVARDGYVAP
ncbi:MAG: ankyrin repeat domain-containing protein [Verrucomicrobiaceae bacterium]|nr:ankyrin repeat domain-containing protein [Verrucomicrobiaceae bacterium]